MNIIKRKVLKGIYLPLTIKEIQAGYLNSPFFKDLYRYIAQNKDTVTFKPTQMLGVVDLRSLGYYKIKQGVLQQNLSHIYHCESANEVCDQFNKLINTLRKEEGKNAEYRKVPMAG